MRMVACLLLGPEMNISFTQLAEAVAAPNIDPSLSHLSIYPRTISHDGQ